MPFTGASFDGAPGVGFASDEIGGDDGLVSRSISAGFAYPRSHGKKVEDSQSESQPEPWAAGVVSSEEKCVRRRSWFCVAIFLTKRLTCTRNDCGMLVEEVESVNGEFEA